MKILISKTKAKILEDNGIDVKNSETLIVSDFIDTNLENKIKAIKGYKYRYDRVKHIMSEFDLDLCIGIDWELEHRPSGEYMTAKHKLLRKYERILGISPKGNKSN